MKAFDEQQLHAYVDNVLSEDERRVVEAYLADHPEDAARVRAWVQQNNALHRGFDPVLDEPHTLRVGARSAPPRRWLPWRLSGALAAGLAGGVALGFALGFFARDFWPEQMAASRVPIARQAALAHAAYLPEVRHPVEVFAQDEAHLVAWLSKRLQVPIRAPSLLKAGYRLLGGRLLPPAGETGDAPVALLMYENEQGKRLSLLLRREPAHRETAFRFSQNGPISVFYWIDGPVGCALAGELSREELNAIARLVYQQLNP